MTGHATTVHATAVHATSLRSRRSSRCEHRFQSGSLLRSEAGRSSAGSLTALVFGYVAIATLSLLAMAPSYRYMYRRDAGLRDAQSEALIDAEMNWLFALVARLCHGAVPASVRRFHDRDVSMKPMTLLLVAYAALGTPAAAVSTDRTDTALARCLDDPVNATTAGQADCEGRAKQDWDRRMNAAYAALMKHLPAGAGHQLRLSQRAWLAFRDADAQARTAFYATRRGTMYVPMEAASETAVTRDRAVQLETRLRVFAIDR